MYRLACSGISGLIYLGLALIAFRFRRLAASIGVGLYGAYLGYQGFRNFDLLLTGWIVKGPVVGLLLLAMLFAMRGSGHSTRTDE